MKNVTRSLVAVAVSAGIASGLGMETVQAAEEAGWHVDLRYRLESVDDAALPEDALASTLRTRLGLVTEQWQGWHGMVEFEDVRTVLLDEDFNDTKNGNANYPVVADPSDTELNQAYLVYGFDDGAVKLGRQRINIDNQRFFGAVGFRQNEQTFDAALLDMAMSDNLRLVAGGLLRANRIFGAHHPNPALANTDMQTGLVDISWKLDAVTLGAYAHLVDLDDNPAASHRNIGLRASGKPGDFDWRLEYANQADHADGSSAIDADYFRGDAGYTFNGIRIGVGHEVLGGDGTYAFQTPFATLHKFNGVTDKFLSTPVDGLVDTEINVKGKAGDWTLGGAWHDFSADNGSAGYGSEFSVFAATALTDYADIRVELGDYSADDYSSDTTKIWVTLGMHF